MYICEHYVEWQNSIGHCILLFPASNTAQLQHSIYEQIDLYASISILTPYFHDSVKLPDDLDCSNIS